METFVTFKKVDNLGRIVIPKDMRRYFDVVPNDYVKIIPTENGILITSAKANSTKGIG